jgi:GNAT superfamily N-acetyltransferase
MHIKELCRFATQWTCASSLFLRFGTLRLEKLGKTLILNVMNESKDLREITASAVAERIPAEQSPGARTSRTPVSRVPVMVPIRSLGANHRERIAAHLKSLDPRDRYLRFGYVASDEQIRRYTDGLNFERDEIFGIYNRKLVLIAMAHLAYPAEKTCDSCAEFGVSVLKSARGRGFGARLFERAAMHARNDGINQMFIHALSENTAMLKIAKRAGAIVQRDGAEAEAHLILPGATLDSQITEIVHEQLALADYRMKAQAHQFRNLLAGLQTIRRAADTSSQ